MGSRTLPTECEHGVVLDWGDHGPDPDDGQAGVEPCAECEAEKPHLAVIEVEWSQLTPTADIPAVRQVIESWIDQLMEALLDSPAVDPSIGATLNANVRLSRDDLDGGFVAERIDLPGCLSQGDTEAEALRNLQAATEAWQSAASPPEGDRPDV